MGVEHLIAKLGTMPTPALVQQRLNVAAKARASGSPDAVALRDAIDSELMTRLGAPVDGWSNGSQGEPRYLVQGGAMIAVVYRLETHGKDRGGYCIEVGGVELDSYPRHVDDARALAEAAGRD